MLEKSADRHVPGTAATGGNHDCLQLYDIHIHGLFIHLHGSVRQKSLADRAAFKYFSDHFSHI